MSIYTHFIIKEREKSIVCWNVGTLSVNPKLK